MGLNKIRMHLTKVRLEPLFLIVNVMYVQKKKMSMQGIAFAGTA